MRYDPKFHDDTKQKCAPNKSIAAKIRLCCVTVDAIIISISLDVFDNLM